MSAWMSPTGTAAGPMRLSWGYAELPTSSLTPALTYGITQESGPWSQPGSTVEPAFVADVGEQTLRV